MGKFVIRATNTGIKFDLKATNGQVVATSEGYKKLASCMKGIESVKKNAPDAERHTDPGEFYNRGILRSIYAAAKA